MKALPFAVVCLCVPISAHAVAISGQGTWETTLQARDLDGNVTTAEAYYDTALDITWFGEANYSQVTTTWQTANAWTISLNPFESGIVNWRLPATIDVGDDGVTYDTQFNGTDAGFNITAHSELSYMFYVTLGNIASYTPSGSFTSCASTANCLSNTGNIRDLRPGAYWSNTGYAPDSGDAWYFDMRNGEQSHHAKSSFFFAWAVHDGDVGTPIATSAVPLPASVWLLGCGLLSLLSVCNRKSCFKAVRTL